MDFGVGAYGLGLVAGVLSTLSPCVLPLVPILLGSAAQAHPRAPLALAGGLALSYAVIGTLLAWAGAALNLNVRLFRDGGAVILGLFGIVLMSASLQGRFSVVTSRVSDAGNELLNRMQLDSLWGQFAIGLMLGVIWSPCVGPTLGAAIVLASQGSRLPQVALLMGLFGTGAALPLVVLAHVSRSGMQRVRGQLMQGGKKGKIALGAILIAVALFILSGADRAVEAWLINHSPAWLTALTVRF